MSRILLGLGSVAFSVLLSLATLAGWYRNLEANPTTAWLIFAAGFVVVAALALLGVWTLLHAVKIDRDEVGKKGSK